MKNTKKIFLVELIFILILVSIDQITKKLAVTHLSEGNFKIIDKVLSLTLLEGGNSGAAFGLLKGGFWFFLIVTVVVIILATYNLYRLPQKNKYTPLRLAIVLLLSGAIGNLIDRVCTMLTEGHSYVVDFIYFELINFPIFNVADMYVTISATVIFTLIIFFYKDEDFELIFKNLKNKEE